MASISEIHTFDEWQTVLATLSEAVILLDARGRLVWANPAAIATYGINPIGVERAELLEWLAVRDPAGQPVALADLPSSRALAGETVPHERFSFTNLIGAELIVLVSAAPILRAGCPIGAVVTWQDVTECERLTAQLAANRERMEALSRRLLEAQEAERRRLACELHDEIGQALTALKINLQSLAHTTPAKTAAPQVDESIQIVERTLQQVRNLSLDLRPSLLDDLGLVAALRWYVDRQGQRVGLTAHFSAEPTDLHLSPEIETACFRLAQEALTNIARHAAAQSVTVTLHLAAERLDLRIDDDGVGFDVPAALARASRGESLGLLGMQERVNLLRGELTIRSAPGQGTQIWVSLPCRS